MIGPILAAGFGAIAFKLGMDAQQMREEGMGFGEIAARLPKSLYDTAAGAAEYVKDTVSGLCIFGCCDDDSACEERVRSKPKKKSAKKPAKKPAAPVGKKTPTKPQPKATPAAKENAVEQKK